MVYSLAKHLDKSAFDFYSNALIVIQESGIPFMVGGAYALAAYTGIHRHTKDLDLFVKKEDVRKILDLMSKKGFRTEFTFPHWLGKVLHGEHYVDVIYSSGNGVATVDQEWFDYASEGPVLGVPCKLIPPEEMLWSKCYVMDRERFDGADVNHVIRACAQTMDWDRLLRRFGPHWRVLLAHIVFFGFTYPNERKKIPHWVMRDLIMRLQLDHSGPQLVGDDEKICQGTLISREQYLVDIDEWGFADARLEPMGPMTEQDITHWTAAIQKKSA